MLRRKASESGTVFVKKPGKMRWDYTTPEKKLFVSDGQTMFLYFPNEKQVMKNAVPAEDQATSAVLFLMGKGDITRDFNVRWADGGTDTTYRLRLDPKTRQAEYDWLEITADRETLRIVGLTAADAQGGKSAFTFSSSRKTRDWPIRCSSSPSREAPRSSAVARPPEARWHSPSPGWRSC